MPSRCSSASKRSSRSTRVTCSVRPLSWPSDWRSDRVLRRLEAMLAIADASTSLVITGSGDVLEPEHGIVAIGSGGAYAQAAARALLEHTELPASAIVKEALTIAGEICIYTNEQLVIEVLKEKGCRHDPNRVRRRNSTSMSAVEYDVTILGAGPVGLALCRRARARAALTVALVDRAPVAVLDRSNIGSEDWDARVYAISPGSAEFLHSLGVWQRLPAERWQPIEAMDVHGDAGGRIASSTPTSWASARWHGSPRTGSW